MTGADIPDDESTITNKIGETSVQDDLDAPSLSGDSLISAINNLRERELIEYHAESEKFSAAMRERDYWDGKMGLLRKGADELSQYFTEKLFDLEQVTKKLPEQLQIELENRKKGIELCNKILDRAILKLDAIPQVSTRSQLNLNMNDIPESEEDSVLEAYRNSLEEQYISNRECNSTIIQDIVVAARESENSFFTLMESQVLPVVDGLDEGKRLAECSMTEILDSYSKCVIDINHWFEIYTDLINRFEEVFALFGVKSQIPNIGDYIDYSKYDPIDVEQDPKYSDEQIKEVLRKCYVLVDADDSVERIVRSGQVVVVKNS